MLLLDNLIAILMTTELFSCFTKAELTALFQENAYTITHYHKDAIIHMQNEQCNTLDIILSGEVAISKIDSNGDMLTISSFSVGDAWGEFLLFSHRNFYPMTIIAKSPAVVLHITKTLILRLCQENVAFLNAFLSSASDKALILTEKIKTLSLKTIRQCIVEFLICEYHLQNSTTIKLHMTKKELAEKIGVQRPSLSRELNKMRESGLISYDAKQITILDFTALNKLHIDS